MKNLKLIVLPPHQKFWCGGLLLSIFLFSGCGRISTEGGFYSVYKVLDGDTIILTNARNVRYIGIDTPESRKRVRGEWVYDPEPYAVEAYNLNRRLVEGKKVSLSRVLSNSSSNRWGVWGEG